MCSNAESLRRGDKTLLCKRTKNRSQAGNLEGDRSFVMSRSILNNQSSPRLRASALAPRRGNTIILVIGIITLLVMIATGYVTRTQGARTGSVATQQSSISRDALDMIANTLAREPAEALFVRPIDTTGLTLPLPSVPFSSRPRLAIEGAAIRYGSDQQDFDGDGIIDFVAPFNFAPYHVVPVTNWPDPTAPLEVNLWPRGPGNPNGPTTGPLASEGNSLGNPTYGDSPWLRDLEPLRWDTNNDFVPDAFSHWRHVTNIARANNAIRISADISNVEMNIINNLNWPFEQWLAIRPNNATNDLYSTVSGNAVMEGAFPDWVPFWNRWIQWFTNYANVNDPIPTYANQLLSPPNLYKLNDLDGDGFPHNFGDRPEDEFKFGTARNAVCRVLADTDGDGFTDSFWYLVPGTVYNGIRQVVAVSIVDNCGMLSANVATRFIRANVNNTPIKTAGLTPTDLALMGQLWDDTGFSNWNVGFYDNPDHHLLNAAAFPYAERFDYAGVLNDVDSPAQRHFLELGFANGEVPGNPPYILNSPTVKGRLDYWNRSACGPLSSDPTSRYVPYGLEDEIELRMFYGQNYPWLVSRYEQTTENGGAFPDNFVRGGVGYEESSEFLQQLVNRMLVLDTRHRLTRYSAARNDIAPPWVWQWSLNSDFNLDGFINGLDRDLNGDGAVDFNDENIFKWGQRKFDLRLGEGTQFFVNNDNDVFIESDVLNSTVPTSIRNFGIALRDRIEQALMDDPTVLAGPPDTYYGPDAATPQDIQKIHELSAGLAANILERRDRVDAINGPYTDETAFLTHAVPVKQAANGEAFLGMEPQPFIVEALVAHDYKLQPVDVQFDPQMQEYSNFGMYAVLEDDDARSTIVVVQIANPFDRPIDLSKYKIAVFGQELELSTLSTLIPLLSTQAPTWPWLMPATPDQPNTAVFYAMKDTITDPFGATGTPDLLKNRWIDFLDIDRNNGDVTPNTMVIDVTLTNRWEVNDRDKYDEFVDPGIPGVDNTSGAIIISRIDDPQLLPSATNPWVVVDRNTKPATPDDDEFAQRVDELGDFQIDNSTFPPGLYDIAANILPFDTDLNNQPIDGCDHYVQWVRFTRAWAVDVNRDGVYDEKEKSPRFIFAEDAVVGPGGGTPDGTYILNSFGNRYCFASAPDGLVGVSDPWFTRMYRRIDNQQQNGALASSATLPWRKPFFFDMNLAADPGSSGGSPWSYPDKGWYGQIGPNGVDDAPCDCDVSTSPVTVNTENVRPRMLVSLQMLQKDGDIEQIGELFNVWLFGHKLWLNYAVNPPAYIETRRTFSEYMADAQPQGADLDIKVGGDSRINRLRPYPASDPLWGGHVVGLADAGSLTDPRLSIPSLPAAVRLMDAFVCDGIGIAPIEDLNGNSAYDQSEIDYRNSLIFSNSKHYDGTATAGMININTAPPEVMRSLPHWYRLVHETGLDWYNNQLFNAAGQPLVVSGNDPAALLPRIMLPEAVCQYRERFNAGSVLPTTGYEGGANYLDRPTMIDPLRPTRGDRGFASIGEVNLLGRQGEAAFIDRPAGGPIDRIYRQYWLADVGVGPATSYSPSALNPPFVDAQSGNIKQVSARTSVDRNDEFNPFATAAPFTRPDTTAGDVEEQNMLFAGASNIVTTRSDTFTVYFRVRSFRQNTSVSPPVWDATNKEYIVDDSRYVMLVDRSTVNRPSDKPRILYLEKLPN